MQKIINVIFNEGSQAHYSYWWNDELGEINVGDWIKVPLNRKGQEAHKTAIVTKVLTEFEAKQYLATIQFELKTAIRKLNELEISTYLNKNS